ncbi:MAG: nucleoside triphosphate pyrophosphohydrolase [Spirochaetales bacterium]|nr:nucleoside triphosphate pyrophosphohydrolase [Spirochaetales bacterium]
MNISNTSQPSEEQVEEIKKAFANLYNIIYILRGPEGCPWDKEQSPYTIRENLLEETYECIHAIEEKNDKNFSEELGDLFLILIMLSRMSEEKNSFSLPEVLDGICKKLIRRHPHVFEKKEAKSVKKIIEHWDYIKEHVEGKNLKASILKGLAKTLPPLERSYHIQKKVSKIGFDWEKPEQVFAKLHEELQELEESFKQKNPEEIEMEIGDLLFTIVNFSRLSRINPGLALERANKKFISRFQKVEARLKEMNITLEEAGIEVLDSLWDSVKSS